MAKASWVNVVPASGTGKGTVAVSASPAHTGRLARTSAITFKAADVENVERTVNQAGRPEFVDIDDTANADKSGQTVTISGISNSAKLTFSLGSGDLDIMLPDSYIANSLTTTNGEAISGDPGASASYNFSIAITVPANETVSEQTRQIIVTDEAGNTDICLLTLAAGELEDFYTFGSYVQHNKTTTASYIPIGYVPKFGDVIETKYTNPISTSNGFPYGCRTSDSASDQYCLYDSRGTRSPRYGDVYQSYYLVNYGAVAYRITPTGYTYEFESGQTGSVEWTSNGTDGTKPMWLFQCNQTTLYTYSFRGSIYYFRVYRDGELIHNYIPAIQKSTDYVGFYDTVNDLFFASTTPSSTYFTLG